MLISVAETLEIPEILPEVIIPRTVARLKRIYDGNYCVGNPLELTPLFTLIFDDVVENRKLITDCGLIPLRKNELPNKMVKGTPEIIQHLSDMQTDAIGHRRYAAEAIECISRISFGLFCDNIRFEFAKGHQLHAQYVTLLSGPGKFSKWTFE
ncbi:MAG: hypothetical protein ABIH70_00800 [Chloroflexota bacterium]